MNTEQRLKALLEKEPEYPSGEIGPWEEDLKKKIGVMTDRDFTGLMEEFKKEREEIDSGLKTLLSEFGQVAGDIRQLETSQATTELKKLFIASKLERRFRCAEDLSEDIFRAKKQRLVMIWKAVLLSGHRNQVNARRK